MRDIPYNWFPFWVKTIFYAVAVVVFVLSLESARDMCSWDELKWLSMGFVYSVEMGERGIEAVISNQSIMSYKIKS